MTVIAFIDLRAWTAKFAREKETDLDENMMSVILPSRGNAAQVILREELRERTRAVHDRLDAIIAGRDLAEPATYGEFLEAQLAARLPVERWLTEHAAEEIRPPATVGLLVEDLQDLGRPFSLAPAPFDMPEGAQAVGAAWAIAGSQMGNRAMLVALRRAGGGQLPTRFLDNPDMNRFWESLRPRLQEKVPAAIATAAVLAAWEVFAAFEAAFSRKLRKLAA